MPVLRQPLLRFLLALSLLLLAGPVAPAAGAVPSTLAYQGLLTDGGGTPVPTGTYGLTFALYDVAAGGSALWTESHPSVGVVNGSFAVTLGNGTSLADLEFNQPYWLGIAVNAGSELAPRIELASAPYALGLRAPATMTSSGLTPTLTVGNGGTGPALRLDGYLEARGPLGGYADAQQATGAVGALSYGGDGTPSFRSGVEIYMPPPAAGIIGCALRGIPNLPRASELYLAGTELGRRVWIRGAHGAGDPQLEMLGNISDFIVDTNLTGDASVRLPDRSVSPSEVLGMPGITHTEGGPVNLQLTMGEVVMTAITTHMDGFIRVVAGGEVRFNGTTGSNVIAYQIDTSANGPEDPSRVRVLGAHQYVSSAFHFMTASAERIYYLPAGTHLFRLIARREGVGVVSFQNPTITAMFLPESNGSVSTMVHGVPTELTELERAAAEARRRSHELDRALARARSVEGDAPAAEIATARAREGSGR